MFYMPYACNGLSGPLWALFSNLGQNEIFFLNIALFLIIFLKWKYNRHQSCTSLTYTMIKFTPRLNMHMWNQIFNNYRDFKEKRDRKIFVVLGGIQTRDLALHVFSFRRRATLQSWVVPAFSVAFFYGRGSNPARHHVNPSIQRRHATAWFTARR